MNTAPIEALLHDEIGLDAGTIGRGAVARVLRRQFAAEAEGDPEALARRLRAEPALLRRVVEEIVVPETWFFRDGRPFAALAAEAVRRRGRGRAIRVLSLPCSTGEEAWSIAIALREAGLAPGEFDVEARDVSEQSLAAAERGVYGKNSFRGEIGEWRARWFEGEVGSSWRVRDELRGSVRFSSANLLALAAPARGYDFVFCRNVLIYFDADTQRAAMGRLRAQLAPDGWLFVGHAEGPVAMRAGFVARPEPGTFVFQLGAPPSSARPEPRQPEGRPMPRFQIAPPAIAAPFSSVASGVSGPRPSASTESSEPVPLAEARRLADLGDLAGAARQARLHLERSGPDAEAYYLLGLTHDAAGMHAAAEADYRRALYLAPRHQEALAQLALLLSDRGEHDAARRLRSRAGKETDA